MNDVKMDLKVVPKRNKETGKIAEQAEMIGALTHQVDETRELANVWQERAITAEASRDSYRWVLLDLIEEKIINLPKEAIGDRYNKYYNPLVENNMVSMRTKKQAI